MVYPVMAPSLLKVRFHILLPFILFSFHVGHAMSTNFYINSRCSVTANYTDGSAFEVNMLSLFSTLTNDALPTGFSNATVGEGSDTVYGLVQCRGDVDEQYCKVCIYNSTVQVYKYCPNTTDAIIWYENCQLRYSNINFFGRLNTDVSGSWHYINDKVIDIKGFNEKLGQLLKNLTSLAAATTTTEPASKLMFATGNISYDGLQTIYGLVQCTGDTSLADCKACLGSTISKIPGTCVNSSGCEIAMGSCRVRYETELFYDPPPPNSSPPSNGQRNRERKLMFVIVLVSVLIAVLITCVLCVFYWWRRHKLKPNGLQRNEEEEAALQQQGYGGQEIDSKSSLVFDLDIIRAATNNFSDANKLGEGGYGPVYKGQLSDGQEIAVKRLSRNSGQGSTEFKNEVKLVAKLQHRNLVRLLGCCFEREEKILIYEYVPNRSLDKLLFDPVRKTHLDWQIRSKIIAGVARGLLYLHEDSRLKIIHRDLKASNILLDQDMTAKISDFGMAKLVGVEETQGKTSKVAGTYGYMAPEYVMQGQFSVKSDVFSFGVLMLETVSGLKNSSFPHSQYGPNLLDYAWRLWRESRATELLDESLTHSSDGSEVTRCIHIGLLCVQEDATRRPTMSSVVLMLNSSSLTLPAPSVPAFLFGRGRLYSETSMAGSSAASTESDMSRSGSVPKSITEMTMTMSGIGAR